MGSDQDGQADKLESGDASATPANSLEPKPIEPTISDAIPIVVKIETKEAHIHEQVTTEKPDKDTRISNELLLSRINTSDRWMIGLTAVIAVTGVLGWLVTWGQMDIMKGQLAEMKAGGTQVDTAITAINRIASSMEESSNQSKIALDYTIEKSKLDQRAWLTVKAAKVRQIIAMGKPPTVAIELHNSGQTPAVGTRLDQHVGFFADKLPDGPMPFGHRDNRNIGVVGPSSSMVGDFTLSDSLTETAMTNLKSRKWSIFTYGTATYFDIFKVQHNLSYCFILEDVAKVDLSPCVKWNNTD